MRVIYARSKLRRLAPGEMSRSARRFIAEERALRETGVQRGQRRLVARPRRDVTRERQRGSRDGILTMRAEQHGRGGKSIDESGRIDVLDGELRARGERLQRVGGVIRGREHVAAEQLRLHAVAVVRRTAGEGDVRLA